MGTSAIIDGLLVFVSTNNEEDENVLENVLIGSETEVEDISGEELESTLDELDSEELEMSTGEDVDDELEPPNGDLFA